MIGIIPYHAGFDMSEFYLETKAIHGIKGIPSEGFRIIELYHQHTHYSLRSRRIQAEAAGRSHRTISTRISPKPNKHKKTRGGGGGCGGRVRWRKRLRRLREVEAAAPVAARGVGDGSGGLSGCIRTSILNRETNEDRTAHINSITGTSFGLRFMFLGSLKGMMSNRARPEGSIAESYIVKECSTFCSMYLHGIETRFNRAEHNYDGERPPLGRYSVFSTRFRAFGHKDSVILTQDQQHKQIIYVYVRWTYVQVSIIFFSMIYVPRSET
uniref:DUF4218 domain-containing protein n=1 Tax=Oryza glumipatula TaxID=40148 RepID=A0A0E0A7D7_9ORYZ